MSDKQLHLLLAVFDGVDKAGEVVEQLPKRNRNVISAVIMRKDSDENVTFRDLGRTPMRGTINGLVLGGVIGVLTGGTGLALGALGGVTGHHRSHKKQAQNVMPQTLHQVAGTLGPDSSAIVVVLKHEPKAEAVAVVEAAGSEIFSAPVPHDVTKALDEQSEQAYEALFSAIAEKTGGEVKKGPPYKRIHVVVNPVSGKDQPILNVLNDIFYRHGVEWDISITKKYGDAAEFARRAAEAGYDLVAGYGGDGTQHEVANGLLGTGVTMGVLPGGTGNGFGTELGIPNDLASAVELLCTSYTTRKVDIVRLADWPESAFIQRLFTGIEPDEQVSREEKNKYGTLAYLGRDIKRLRELQDIAYTLTIDGEVIEVQGYKCYVVNSAKAGTGLAISNQFKVDDGMLDVFMLSTDKKSSSAALNRFFSLENETAGMFYWRGQSVKIDADVDQPVWTDGEYTGRTPVEMEVVPGGLTVAVAEALEK